MPGPLTRLWLAGWDRDSHGLMGWAVAMSNLVAGGEVKPPLTRHIEGLCAARTAKPTAAHTPS